MVIMTTVKVDVGSHVGGYEPFCSYTRNLFQEQSLFFEWMQHYLSKDLTYLCVILSWESLSGIDNTCQFKWFNFVFQYWNRLSSLQRSVICVVLILGTVSTIYLLPSIYGGNDEVDFFSRKRQVHVNAFDQSKGVAADVDKKFAQQAIDSIKKKANDYIKDKGVSCTRNAAQN